jgi:hypothetical protein
MLTTETMRPRKLQLAKETLRELTPFELTLVAGGNEWHHHHRHHCDSDSSSDSDSDSSSSSSSDSHWSDP